MVYTVEWTWRLSFAGALADLAVTAVMGRVRNVHDANHDDLRLGAVAVGLTAVLVDGGLSGLAAKVKVSNEVG